MLNINLKIKGDAETDLIAFVLERHPEAEDSVGNEQQWVKKYLRNLLMRTILSYRLEQATSNVQSVVDNEIV